MKIKFIKEKSDQDSKEVIIETENVLLDDILVDFTDFLRACGFVIDYNNHLEIVEDIE